jgi:glucose/arabinose dehydrogenase
MVRCLLRLVLLVSLIPLVGWPSAVPAHPAPVHPLGEPLPAETVVETVVPKAGGFVVAMAFAPDGRLFYTVKGGFSGDTTAQVRIVAPNGTLRPTPFLDTPVNTERTRGLLGIALDPAFATNHYVYLYKTAPASETGTGRPANRVVRYTEDPTTQTAQPGSATILLEVPVGVELDRGAQHMGGNLHFGPDGKLYITIGDYGKPGNAQNLAVIPGKIHRLNPDGSVPRDNPFVATPGALPSVWSYGHRNSFDFTFDPVHGRLFFTENGPECDDEVNLGQAGGNYGWGDSYTCGGVPDGTLAPVYRYAQSIGLTGIDFYQGGIAAWHNTLFWCALNTGQLYHAMLDASRTRIGDVQVVEGAPVCLVDVQHGPDGALYLAANEVIARIRPR